MIITNLSELERGQSLEVKTSNPSDLNLTVLQNNKVDDAVGTINICRRITCSSPEGNTVFIEKVRSTNRVRARYEGQPAQNVDQIRVKYDWG